MTDPDEARRERRRWIRDHHPDRGGDPAAFAAGLAARDGHAAAPGPRPDVRRTRRVRRTLRRWRKTLRRRLSGRRHRGRVR